jgi:hypothetical protein
MFLIELIPAESRFSFDCGFRACAIMPSAGLSGPVESRLRRASKVSLLDNENSLAVKCGFGQAISA